MPSAELFASAGALHAEGPFWDEPNGRLLFADALAGAIAAVEMTGLTNRFLIPSPVVTVIRRRTSGGYAVATEHGLSVCDESLSMCDSVAQLTSDTTLRNNDGGCDPLGGFAVGTMAYGEITGKGSKYRVAPDHRITRLLSGVSWIALRGASAVNHYDAAGCHIETIPIPGVSQVSSCAFGGRDRSMLFTTTSRQHLAPGDQPLAGSIFEVHTDFRGAVPAEFAG